MSFLGRRAWPVLLLAGLARAAPGQTHWYVHATNGNDAFTGLTPAQAFRTIQRAAAAAAPGAVVHIAPGAYRESVTLTNSGTAEAPIVFRGETSNGARAVLSGAVSSRTLSWTRLGSNTIGLPAHVAPTNLFHATLAGWTNGPSRLTWVDGTRRVPLPRAREPDWTVTTEGRFHENWWKADSGSTIRLWDRTNDAPGSYPDVQTGHLGWISGVTNSFLTGAVVVATDGTQAHDTYRRRVIQHVAVSGLVRFADSTLYPLGSNTKYYVEGPPQCLDQPGEWCIVTNRLYLWPPAPTHPTNLAIEIARRGIGFNLRHVSHVRLEDLVIEDLNNLEGGYTGDEAALWVQNWAGDSRGLVFDRLTIRDVPMGLRLYANAALGMISNLALRSSTIGPCDGQAILSLYDTGTAARVGVSTLLIQSNEFRQLGFASRIDQGLGLLITRPHRLLFQGNRVHEVMQNGLVLVYGEQADTLVLDNLFERCGQGAADCAGFKIWADGGAASDILVMRNTFRDTTGWTFPVSQINWWDTSRGRFAGFGAYTDIVQSPSTASYAAVFYRNTATGNGYAGFYCAHSRDIALFNNVSAGQPHGISLDGQLDRMPGLNSNSVAKNNLLLVAQTTASLYADSGLSVRLPSNQMSRLDIDHNVYRVKGPGAAAMRHYHRWDNQSESWRHNLYTNAIEIRARTPWEDHGRDAPSESPAVANEEAGDFHLYFNCPAVDAGTVPQVALDLMARLAAIFDMDLEDSPPYGAGYDAGPLECHPAPFELIGGPPPESPAPLLRWSSVHGALYTVEQTTALTNSTWDAAAQVPSSGYQTTWHSTNSMSRLFYRIRLDGPQ